MAWPPTTHGDVEDAVSSLRGMTQFPAGVFVTPPGVTSGTTTPTVGTISFAPIFLPAGVVGDVAVRVVTAATAASGGTVQIGIYDTSATLTNGRIPGTLLSAGTPISTETTGPRSVALGQAVTGGLYWLAALPLVSTATFATLSTESQTGRPGTAISSGLSTALASFQQTGQATLPSSTSFVSLAGNAGGIRSWVSMSTVN